MTCNDHGIEVRDGVAKPPNPNPDNIPSLWQQFIDLLEDGYLLVTADGSRLQHDCRLKVLFSQWITDGAGARGNHFRTQACSCNDCAHFTPQQKALRQMLHLVCGVYILRFGAFPGFKGQVVHDLVAKVMAGVHQLNMTQLTARTGITAQSPFHSSVTPMDAVRINPGPWHCFATWAYYWLCRIAWMMFLRDTLKIWHQHMLECVKVCGKFQFWPLTGGGFSIYGKDAGDLRNWLLLCSGEDTFSCNNPVCMKHATTEVCNADGHVHFIGPEQTKELSFIMVINAERIQTFDEVNTEVFWRRASFLPLQGVAHDNHVASIFGPSCLNTKTAEATYLFPAIVHEVLTPTQCHSNNSINK